MKQLYVIGILVAVILLALLGLSKLNTPKSPATDASEDVSIEVKEEKPAEKTLQTPIEETPEPMDTQAQAQTENAGNTMVVMKTNKGDITIELFTKDMPVTAGNFLKLAQENFYDGIKFHRVIDGFMIQGGDPLTKDDTMIARWGTGGPGHAIQDEFVANLSNARGTLSMANSGPNTGGSQFFINTADNTFLNGKHPVFGRVVAGMEVVDAIGKVKTVEPGMKDRPVDPVIIADIEIKG